MINNNFNHWYFGHSENLPCQILDNVCTIQVWFQEEHHFHLLNKSSIMKELILKKISFQRNISIQQNSKEQVHNKSKKAINIQKEKPLRKLLKICIPHASQSTAAWNVTFLTHPWTASMKDSSIPTYACKQCNVYQIFNSKAQTQTQTNLRWR